MKVGKAIRMDKLNQREKQVKQALENLCGVLLYLVICGWLWVIAVALD